MYRRLHQKGGQLRLHPCLPLRSFSQGTPSLWTTFSFLSLNGLFVLSNRGPLISRRTSVFRFGGPPRKPPALQKDTPTVSQINKAIQSNHQYVKAITVQCHTNTPWQLHNLYLPAHLPAEDNPPVSIQHWDEYNETIYHMDRVTTQQTYGECFPKYFPDPYLPAVLAMLVHPTPIASTS